MSTAANSFYSYSPEVMRVLWEVAAMPDGVAILSFDNKTYEVTVKQLAPSPNTAAGDTLLKGEKDG